MNLFFKENFETQNSLTIQCSTIDYFIFGMILGAIFILPKDIGVCAPENGNFPLLYVVKMSLCRWVGGSEKPQNTLT